MKNLIILFTSLALLSCQSNQKSEVAILKDSVMSIHDEVMPKMGELMKTSKALVLLADSIAVTDSLKASVLSAVATEIDMANESMMNWMRSYEPEYEGSEKEVLTYLEGQKESIQKVKDDMENSLAKGKEVLSEN